MPCPPFLKTFRPHAGRGGFMLRPTRAGDTKATSEENRRMTSKGIPLAVVAALSSTLVRASVLYVNLNGTNSVPPYADWSAAATKIQDAVDASSAGDQILVTNGIYQTGGRVVY